MTKKSLTYKKVRIIILSIVFVMLAPQSYLHCEEEGNDIRVASEEVMKGDALYGQRRLWDSLTHYKKALIIKPSADLYFKIGMVYMNLSKTLLAEEFFLQAIRLNNEYAPAYKALGEVYVERLEAKPAREAFNKAQELFSKNGDMLEAVLCKGCEKTVNHIITVSKLQDESSEEKDELLKVSQAEAYRRFIELLFQRSQSNDRDPQKILYYCELAAEQTLFKHPQALYKLGMALLECGRYAKAIKEFKVALSLRPGYRDAQYNLAIAYGADGQYKKAKAIMMETILIDPRWPYAYKQLAVYYMSRNQSETCEKLENLPVEVKFPYYRRWKISYSADSKLLIFKGVMSKEEKKILLGLSRDGAYKQSIKALYKKSRATETKDLAEENLYKAGLLFLEEKYLEEATNCLKEIKLLSQSKSALYRELKRKIEQKTLCKIGD